MTMSAQSALASFASDTLIQVPGGTRAVSSLSPGDSISAASSTSAPGDVPLKAQRISVINSSSPSIFSMVRLTYSLNGKNQDLVVNGDQPLSLSTGQLIRACNLVTGQKLLTGNGGQAPILSSHMGSYSGRVISIAGDSGDQNNTLLIANGVVAGSYLAEVALLDQRNGRI